MMLPPRVIFNPPPHPTHTRTHTPHLSPLPIMSLWGFCKDFFFCCCMNSAPAQLDHIHFRLVQVSDVFLFVSFFLFCFFFFLPLLQIWTSPVSSQSIKPNYPHYKGLAVDTVKFILFRQTMLPFTEAKHATCGWFQIWLTFSFLFFPFFPSRFFSFYSKPRPSWYKVPLQEIGDGWPRWVKTQNVYTISGNVDFLFSVITRTMYCTACRKNSFMHVAQKKP